MFTRDQLLREVWGYDYFGGTRTVDVHVRRLRAKLGGEHEALIGTVRQVGYKFVVVMPRTEREPKLPGHITSDALPDSERPRLALATVLTLPDTVGEWSTSSSR